MIAYVPMACWITVNTFALRWHCFVRCVPAEFYSLSAKCFHLLLQSFTDYCILAFVSFAVGYFPDSFILSSSLKRPVLKCWCQFNWVMIIPITKILLLKQRCHLILPIKIPPVTGWCLSLTLSEKIALTSACCDSYVVQNVLKHNSQCPKFPK